MKRLFEFPIALAALLLAAPVCLVLIALIRLETPGPGLFVQTRVGADGRPFRMLKLRTMTIGTGNLPSHEVNVHRLTRLGGILRRLKLDELPQLWNVLTGSMSFVGPRPCLPTQTELIEARRRRGVLAYRPGITGPGQVAGIDMSQPVKLAEVEAAYFPRSTAASDIRLIIRTVLGAGAGDVVTRAGRN